MHVPFLKLKNLFQFPFWCSCIPGPIFVMCGYLGVDNVFVQACVLPIKPSIKMVVCSTPLSDQSQNPGGKAVYPGGPGTKITSVSTGNLCADVSSRSSVARGIILWNSSTD